MKEVYFGFSQGVRVADHPTSPIARVFVTLLRSRHASDVHIRHYLTTHWSLHLRGYFLVYGVPQVNYCEDGTWCIRHDMAPKYCERVDSGKRRLVQLSFTLSFRSLQTGGHLQEALPRF